MNPGSSGSKERRCNSVELKVYNTLHREIEPFHPIEGGEVSLYACGPTVYNYAHIGNLRTYIFEDILRRSLEYFGYEVRHVMNVTDVGHLTDDADQGEDKMEVSAREKKMSVWEIAEFFTDAFFQDLEKLNIELPTQTCRATDHIGDMIRLIQRLEEKGYTYVAGGNVYFDISKFPDYGKLALLERQELKSGARVERDPNKRNPRDFVLWFTQSKFEHQTMQWDSPWGRGYPGWHVECSAMSMKYLGEQFDIHTGGVDHIPVHHTNEIAQSEAATGKKWVNYWLHGEFLVMKGAKMAKSAGNFITISVLEEEGFEPLDYRYFCLGGHYRSQLIFTKEALEAARAGRRNLNERVLKLKEEEEKRTSSQDSQYILNFNKHLANDLNIPRCLSEMWGLLKDKKLSPKEKLSELYRMDSVLGLELSESTPKQETLDPKYMELLQEREEARKSRDYERADEIRDYLFNQGITIKDTPQGTEWHLS